MRSGAALRRGEWQGRIQSSRMPISHEQVLKNFIQEGASERGHSLVVQEKHHAVFSVFGRHGPQDHGIPLAIRLKDGGFLANGAGLFWPISTHQRLTLEALHASQSSFGVVPFDSVAAAWTDGRIRDWNSAPFRINDIRREVAIVVPSEGEEYREVPVRDTYGRIHTQYVHTLGDSVIRLRDHFYLSGVDETGIGRGIYFLARLITDRAPASFEEALSLLKPKAVRDAEARGAYVRRQGEWFAIPTKLITSQLLGDVGRGLAVRREQHVLGRDGNHQLEEAVIYRVGPRRGEVYARGNVTHTEQEHDDLSLGIRWHLMVHNIQGASYSLGGNFD